MRLCQNVVNILDIHPKYREYVNTKLWQVNNRKQKGELNLSFHKIHNIHAQTEAIFMNHLCAIILPSASVITDISMLFRIRFCLKEMG